jgi:hypothetical protein
MKIENTIIINEYSNGKLCKVYLCPFCKDKFRYKVNLDKHVKTCDKEIINHT